MSSVHFCSNSLCEVCSCYNYSSPYFLTLRELLATKLRPFRSRSCCNAKIYGKIVLNEEIPVNRYHKKDDHGSKFMETMFIIDNVYYRQSFEGLSVLMLTVDKALKYYPFQC